MRAIDIIAQKRDGGELSAAEIDFFIQGFARGEIPDYQAAAWLMAVYLQGMSRPETIDLTMAMARSGQMLDLEEIAPLVVDKHSTGGVGDKVSLVLAPLLAEYGLRVPMIARWPGRIRPGTTSDHISAFWDFLPTCADILGVDAPVGLDGISFLPTLLQKGAQREHDYMYWEFYERNGRQAVLQGKWKAVRLNVHDGPDQPIQLYDLEVDPGETTDVSVNNLQIVQEMKDLIDAAHVRSSVFKFSWE